MKKGSTDPRKVSREQWITWEFLQQWTVSREESG